MRPENKKMQDFLKQNGINAIPKHIAKGSQKGVWRLTGIENKKAVGNYGLDKYAKWTQKLADKLNGLGFKDFDGTPLDIFSGNGGIFSVFVRGHNELLTGKGV